MAKVKFNGTGGRKIPTEVTTLVSGLQDIIGVKSVGYGEYSHTGNTTEPTIELRTYDEASNILKIRINRQDYRQIVLIKTPHPNIELITFLKSYKF